MKNSINRSKNLITPEKAASFIPVFISAGVSILVIILFVIPQYSKSVQVNSELNGLIKKKNDLDNLKKQYKLINKKFDQLNKEKSQIIELISGKSNLETLLSRVGEIGKKNNIKFTSIVPKKLMIAVDSDQEKNLDTSDDEIDIVFDPLLVEGVKKYEIDFSFSTEFINLVAFLRDLEFQENVILVNDINLNLVGEDNNEIEDAEEILAPYEILEANLNIVFYGRI